MSGSSPGPPSRGEVWLVDLDPTRGREQVRCVARERLLRRVGRAPGPALARIGVVLRALLEL